jgi:hypothetical protein
MPEEALKPAIRATLRMHEIGTNSPYRLYFAGKGKSGASFGFMQGDLAANQPIVVSTFKNVLSTQGFSAADTSSFLNRLSVHLVSNPLTKAETDRINAALNAQQSLVDAMDEQILQKVYDDLDLCLSTAATAGRTIEPEALLFLACWINMSGRPTKVLTWINGGDPHLAKPVPAPGSVITAALVEQYLKATSYYVSNPGNIPHLLESVDAGAKLLPGSGGAALVAMAATGAAATIGVPGATSPSTAYADIATGDHLVYEQATGRLLIYEQGSYDSLAVGYSGSLSRHGVNDPSKQCVRGTGPLPRGIYAIGAPGPGPSPYSLRLTPDSSNDMCGRSGFLIHGDSVAHPGDASDGCIILNRPERERIVATGLKTLIVVDRISA